MTGITFMNSGASVRILSGAALRRQQLGISYIRNYCPNCDRSSKTWEPSSGVCDGDGSHEPTCIVNEVVWEKDLDRDWKKDHANASKQALKHPLVEEVIKELMLNLRTDSALVRYGISKVATYAAQVARAQALGINPDTLRMDREEAQQALMEKVVVVHEEVEKRKEQT